MCGGLAATYVAFHECLLDMDAMNVFRHVSDDDTVLNDEDVVSLKSGKSFHVYRAR